VQGSVGPVEVFKDALIPGCLARLLLPLRYTTRLWQLDHRDLAAHAARFILRKAHSKSACH
jgi:hypothetical protein